MWFGFENMLVSYADDATLLALFYFLPKIFSFLTGLSSLLGPSGFWHLALPVGVCSLECNNNNNNNNNNLKCSVMTLIFAVFLSTQSLQSLLLSKSPEKMGEVRFRT